MSVNLAITFVAFSQPLNTISIPVVIVDNIFYEERETFTLSVTSNSPLASPTLSTATAEILVNDGVLSFIV